MAAAYGTVGYQHPPGNKLFRNIQNLHNTKTGFLRTFPLLQEPLHFCPSCIVYSTSCALLTNARLTR
jgi:hypothetical protein